MNNIEERIKWMVRRQTTELDLIIHGLICKIGFPVSIKRNLMLLDSAKNKYGRIIIDVKVPSVTGDNVVKMLNVSYAQAFKYVVNGYADVEIFYKDDVKGWTKYEPQITIKEPFEHLEEICKDLKYTPIDKIKDAMRGESKVLDDKLLISDKMKTNVTPHSKHIGDLDIIHPVMSLRSIKKRIAIPCLILYNTSAYSDRLEFNIDDIDSLVSLLTDSEYYIYSKLNRNQRVYRYPHSGKIGKTIIRRDEEYRPVIDLLLYEYQKDKYHIVMRYNEKTKILTGEFYFNHGKTKIKRTEAMGIPTIERIEFFKD